MKTEEMGILDICEEIGRLAKELEQGEKERKNYLKQLDEFWAGVDRERERLAKERAGK